MNRKKRGEPTIKKGCQTEKKNRTKKTRKKNITTLPSQTVAVAAAATVTVRSSCVWCAGAGCRVASMVLGAEFAVVVQVLVRCAASRSRGAAGVPCCCSCSRCSPCENRVRVGSGQPNTTHCEIFFKKKAVFHHFRHYRNSAMAPPSAINNCLIQ